eukprot:sb/3471346/
MSRSTNMIDQLPLEVVSMVLEYLPAKSTLEVACVSQTMLEAAGDSRLWLAYCERDFNVSVRHPSLAKEMYRTFLVPSRTLIGTWDRVVRPKVGHLAVTFSKSCYTVTGAWHRPGSSPSRIFSARFVEGSPQFVCEVGGRPHPCIATVVKRSVCGIRTECLALSCKMRHYPSNSFHFVKRSFKGGF